MTDLSKPETEPQSTATSAPSDAPEESWFSRLRGSLGRKQHSSLRASLAELLSRGETDEDVFSPEERAMLRNILALRGKRVDDVMVPRADIVAVEEGTSLGALLSIFREAGHSRLPIYRETLDDPIGLVHIKDLMSFLLSGDALKADDGEKQRPRAEPLRHLAKVDFAKTLGSARISRIALFVPPSMPAIDLLVQMQTTRVHMALVIDEYGGTDGLITIEDLIEEVVGDIEDEHDFDEAPMITERGDGGFVVDARADLEDVSAAVGVDLDLGEEAEDVDTLGGLIVTLAGRVPVRGELIAGPAGLEFEVLDADPRRLKRIGVHRRATGAAAEARRERKRAETSPPPEGAPADAAGGTRPGEATPDPIAKRAATG